MTVSEGILKSIEDDDTIDNDFKEMIIKFLRIQDIAIEQDSKIEHSIKNQLETKYGINNKLVEWCRNYE